MEGERGNRGDVDMARRRGRRQSGGAKWCHAGEQSKTTVQRIFFPTLHGRREESGVAFFREDLDKLGKQKNSKPDDFPSIRYIC
jgi:hypothetical protein